LLIAAAATAAACPRQLWREKHDVLDLLVDGRSGTAGLDARRRRGLDQRRDDDSAHVQRYRRCDLWRTQLMRQPRSARRERVEMKHDQRCRKADTVGSPS
jgi:hypothetical protein